jgi:alkanesulfonate monooxygenase SsuD/methylene tetrahydromethanopterin reductase-like flavin-dependent oxidoreductase (luciferase family)
MRFMLEYPVAHSSYSEEFLDPDVMSALAVSAECAGFAAIGFTDHPAPSEKWMRAGWTSPNATSCSTRRSRR